MLVGGRIECVYQCVAIHVIEMISGWMRLSEEFIGVVYIHDSEVCIHVLVGGRGECDLLQYGI